ncbi:MAG: hypothetical protein INQ03_12650 [Candidatus Heimdallarchaeota archaeon]|nr:hypothetical protein [Candidatus Heimdallarchaeota archaeon]
MNNQILVILHAYQPPYPIQEKFVLDKIVEECYRPIAKALKSYPRVKFLLNINASLSEMLEEDAKDVLRLFNEAAQRGQIEFLNTGAYHPILPLLDDHEKDIQLQKNIEINERLIGNSFKPRGFFPPELAVNQQLMEYLAQHDYKFVMIPENSVAVNHQKGIPYIEFQGKKLYLIQRDKSLSNHISFAQDKNNLEGLIKRFTEKAKNRNKPTVFAADIETFGHHHKDYWKFFFSFLSHTQIEPVLSETYFKHKERVKMKRISSSSWSTDDSEVNQSIPFPLWDHPRNPVHVTQQLHFTLVRKLFDTTDINYYSRKDQSTIMAAYHSCQFWWASGNGRWSPSMIKKGFKAQMKALQLMTTDPLYLELSDDLFRRLEFTLKNISL